MITSIEIENLRGIRHGRLEGLAPLTILTGPNASGKSTVLDALLIGATPNPADGVGQAVARHPQVTDGSRWLCSHEDEARIVLSDSRSVRWERRLKLAARPPESVVKSLMEVGSPPPYSSIGIKHYDPTGQEAPDWIAFGADNQYRSADLKLLLEPRGQEVRLVDPGLPIPLHRVFTHVAEAGRREQVHSLLSHLLPGFERLEIIATSEDTFGLAISGAGKVVPVGASGDGVQAFVQLALGIAAAPKGLVLVEEPEVYQHPRAIWQSALALLENVRRGVQMVVTTHSLELIDALLAQAEDTLGEIVLFNVLLEDGELKSGRRDGDQIAFARQTLERDLR